MCSNEKNARPKWPVTKATPVEIEVDGSSKLPHNCDIILKDADPPISLYSNNLTEHLRSGVFLKPQKSIKYWVDEKNSNCFLLFPRKLSITWSDNPTYWKWFQTKEPPNGTIVETVKMKNVCWLDITGKFDTKDLTPGIKYEVVFKLKLGDSAAGWKTPVNLKLVFPNCKDQPQEQKVSLKTFPKSQWIDLKVGEFVPEKCAGEITFSIYEHNKFGIWKSGLFLRGVTISPKRIN